MTLQQSYFKTINNCILFVKNLTQIMLISIPYLNILFLKPNLIYPESIILIRVNDNKVLNIYQILCYYRFLILVAFNCLDISILYTC